MCGLRTCITSDAEHIDGNGRLWFLVADVTIDADKWIERVDFTEIVVECIWREKTKHVTLSFQQALKHLPDLEEIFLEEIK